MWVSNAYLLHRNVHHVLGAWAPLKTQEEVVSHLSWRPLSPHTVWDTRMSIILATSQPQSDWLNSWSQKKKKRKSVNNLYNVLVPLTMLYKSLHLPGPEPWTCGAELSSSVWLPFAKVYVMAQHPLLDKDVNCSKMIFVDASLFLCKSRSTENVTAAFFLDVHFRLIYTTNGGPPG